MKRLEMIQNYLQVLDLEGRKMDFSFLKDVMSRHVATFAFSSVGCQLGDNLPLDFESLYQRIVIKRRGGYCFEQNRLLFEVLEELGFSLKLYLARVINNKDTHPGLTHRITMVEYDNQQYVLDVGFGFHGPSEPISMSGVESNDGRRTFRIREGRTGEFHMQILKNEDFFSLYRFELSRYGEADCVLGHFFSHQHPDANFVNHLVVSRILENETRTIVDLKYSVVKKSETLYRDINDAGELGELLINELGVQVTESESYRLYDKLKAKVS